MKRPSSSARWGNLNGFARVSRNELCIKGVALTLLSGWRPLGIPVQIHLSDTYDNAISYFDIVNDILLHT